MADPIELLKNVAEGLALEIERLEETCQTLDEMLGDVEHQRRRSRDDLERMGGAHAEIEHELKLLAENQRLTTEDRDRNRARLAELEQSLTDIFNRIQTLERG
jgi:chromosome segregation ATPase